jgi:hypothetical protein
MLGALALCMIGGAVLLGWLEPTPQDYADGRLAVGPRTDSRLLQGLARQVVRTTTSAPREPWSSVELVALDKEVAGTAAVLSARTPPENLHFLVDRDGQFRALPSWQRQLPVSERAQVIRVGLRGVLMTAGLSDAQWAALRALLVELDNHANTASGRLPIHLAADRRRTERLSPTLRQLRELLVREGLLG